MEPDARARGVDQNDYRMTIWLYCICRNEEKILPYFLRHYTPWVDRLIFYDGKSTDSTRAMIKAAPGAELRDWPGSDALVDDEFLTFANEQWKEARGHADWVIWVDADEFLYHPTIRFLLSQYLYQNIEVPRVEGFTMVHPTFPTTPGQIYDEVRHGFHDPIWAKNAIFRGNMVWTMGRHGVDFTLCKPIMSPLAELKLLHYRGLGIEYVRERHRRNWERVPEHCRQRSLGSNTSPDYVGNHSVEWFAERINQQWPTVI